MNKFKKEGNWELNEKYCYSFTIMEIFNNKQSYHKQFKSCNL